MKGKNIHRYFLLLGLLISSLYVPCLGFAQSSETDLLSAAQQAFNDGFNDVATRYLEDFINKYPQSTSLPSAKILLGECDFLQGQYDKALVLFEDLSQQAYKKDEILYWEGETYLKENRLADAQQDYQKVISDFSQSSYVPQALYSLGWSFFRKKSSIRPKKFFHT